MRRPSPIRRASSCSPLLRQGSRTVEVLAKEAGIGLIDASQHLKVRRVSRWVQAEKNSLFVTYRLADPRVAGLLHAFRALAESRLVTAAEAIDGAVVCIRGEEVAP